MKRDSTQRVIFYSTTDGSCYSRLEIAEPILKSFDLNYPISDINDIIELDQIRQFINANMFLPKWTEQERTLFKAHIPIFDKLIGKFLSDIDDNNILNHYEALDLYYHKAFWKLIDNQKVYKKISSNIFIELLQKTTVGIREILKYKNIVTRFKVPLRTFLLEYPHTTELLISIHENLDKPLLLLPDNLTNNDKEEIISSYLDSEKANLNYIRLLINLRNNKNLSISDKLRLKAKKRAKEEQKRIFNQGNSTSSNIEVRFQVNQEKIKDIKYENGELIASYSENYIKQNNDNISLFNNFIFLFDFLDPFRRIDLISKEYDMGILRYIGIHSKNTYLQSPNFIMRESLSLIQIFSYKEILIKINKSIEEVICFHVNEYLSKEYNIPNLHITLSTGQTSYLEKIRILAPEFESLLKQYNLFVTEKEIDPELMQISSQPTPFSIIGLNDKKYIYLNKETESVKALQGSFFSDQSGLAYVEPFNDKYVTLFDLLINEKVNFENFAPHQTPIIQYFIDTNYLSIDSSNIVRLENLKELLILKDLYENEFGSYQRYTINFQEIADKMAKKNMIYFGNTLLSKQEQSYFNFYLNKAEFTNGLDLRNSYLHGTQGAHTDSKKQEQDYFTYLKLLILLICKIEDDLCIARINKLL